MDQSQLSLRTEGPALRSLGGRNILFSELGQALLEVDDLTARLLHASRDDGAVEELTAELLASGLSRQEAADCLQQRLELISVHARGQPIEGETRRTPVEGLQSMSLEIAGVRIHLHLSPQLVPEVTAVVGQLASPSIASHAQVVARAQGRVVEVLPPGAPAWSCDREEFVPLLKAELIQHVLDLGNHQVALHAAGVARDDTLTLLLGSPGAGKTTLAIALHQLGFELVADDVMLMDGNGSFTGLAFPFASKMPSWPLLSAHWPEVVEGPTHRRPDGQQVRFATVKHWAPQKARKIGRVIVLDRQDSDAQLLELNPVDALLALIAEGDAPGSRLDRKSFFALADAVASADCKRLVYRDFFEAAQLVSSR